MSPEQSNSVECPTCKGLGVISSTDKACSGIFTTESEKTGIKNCAQSTDSPISENGQLEKYTFVESKAFIHHNKNRSNSNLKSDGNNLKLLTKMDAIIGCITDQLPEKAPFENPKEVIKSMLVRLKNTNPEEYKRAITDAVQVSREHQDLLKPYMNLINQKIVHFLNSQRILYIRFACQAAGELFRTMRCTDRPIFDNIVTGLMYRTADKNQNVRIDANWALDKMVISIAPVFTIKVVANCHHKNPAVKIVQLRLMSCVTMIVDPIKILTSVGLKETRQLILKTCVAAMEDGNSDIRFMSKKLMRLLMNTCYESFCSALVQDFSWDELRVAEKNLNVEDLAAVLKKKKIK